MKLQLQKALNCSTRGLHTVPRLAISEVPGLFSPEAFDIAWNQHQADILGKLSKATVDTDNAARIPFHILLNAARRRDSAHVFNYASQAHNNHLFFSALGQGAMSPGLSRRIERGFGSVDNLLDAFKKAASSIDGNGWVFLVETANKSLEVVVSNNAGTPYHFARQQNIDLNTAIDEDQAKALEDADALVSTGTKNYNICLLALNLWQHAYLQDFGVAGRDAYIDAWTKQINWSVVSARLFGETLA